MQFQTSVDSFGRLICRLSDEEASAVVTAADAKQAQQNLACAVERLIHAEQSDVWWSEAAGEYRWVFRRSGDSVRVAVLWSTGTATGWEHVFYTECSLMTLLQEVLSPAAT